tara:strand:+ start:228 stop:392 length:165 start_codon:yes stop_codon:yes gene_type:complete
MVMVLIGGGASGFVLTSVKPSSMNSYGTIGLCATKITEERNQERKGKEYKKGSE